ncbi:MAG: substrate-binding domain-containing protein, partial [Syntrophales bacterium LBB04]|nr:substrate-binding domain-containing protein [Syntrophales bacterium LBB04]
AAAPAPMAAWEQEWADWLSRARKEGKVTIYTTAGSDVRQALQNGFSKKYGIEIETVMGRGGELTQKIETERRAGLYLGDIYMGGPTTMLNVLKPKGVLEKIEPLLLLPEVIQRQAWVGGKLPFLDPEGCLVGIRFSPQTYVTVNSKLVRDGEVRSLRNLLEPKWKGKIAMQDPTVEGIAQEILAMVGERVMDWNYVERLAKQEPVILRDDRLLGEWVARGKYPIGFGLKIDVIKELAKAGAPLSFPILEEGTHVSPGAGCFSLLDKSPHPYAKRIFVNWILSRDGITTYSKASMTGTARLDVPTDHLPDSEIRNPSIKYAIADGAFYLTKPEFENKLTDIFAGFSARSVK